MIRRRGAIGVYAGVHGIGLPKQGRAAALGRRGAVLPSPLDCPVRARADEDPHEEVSLAADPSKPTVAMAFKIVEDPYGALTFMRIYQGSFVRGATYYNQRNGRKERSAASCACTPTSVPSRGSRGRRHRGRAGAGRRQRRHLRLRVPLLHAGKHVRARAGHPMAIAPAEREGADRLGKALHRFAAKTRRSRSQPTRKTSETLIAGMGDCTWKSTSSNPPRVQRRGRGRPAQGQLSRGPHASRRVQHPAPQADGRSGQYAHIVGRLDVCPRTPRRHSSSRSKYRRANPQAIHSGHRKGIPVDVAQGTDGRLSGRRPGGLPRRRLLPRGRQLGYGVPDLRQTAMRESFPDASPCCWSR